VAESKTPENDARLLAQLAAGRAAAFAELYQRFGPRLYRTALGLLGRREDAEDAVQEVFAALVRSRRRLAEVRDLAAYLFASLRRQSQRRLARRKQQPQGLPPDCAGREPPADDPRGEALDRALRSLPAEQLEVIAMKIEGELTFAEIGRVLSISPHTAASRYRYALERLRERLQHVDKNQA
jgi:RNA polymerase sigma-70 factor (ECF subfamily)